MLGVFFITWVFCSNAQSFRRGAVVLDLNTGIEFYNTNLSYAASEQGSRRDTVVQSQAANSNLALGLEVGLSKRFGIGVRGKANKFFEDVDAVTSSNTNITSTDLMVMVNIHPIVRKKLDLVIGSDIGISGFNFRMDDLDRTLASGKGTYLTVYLNPRLYLGRFGFNLKTYIPFLNYRDLESSNEEGGDFLISKWKGSGVGVTAGVQFRLFKD